MSPSVGRAEPLQLCCNYCNDPCLTRRRVQLQHVPMLNISSVREHAIATTAAIMSISGEDHEDFEEDSQPSQTLPAHKESFRPSKRRKIDNSEDDSIDDFIEDDGYEVVARGKGGRHTSIGYGQDEFSDFESMKVRKNKSKHRIHIPKDNTIPAATVQYGTQGQDSLDSSPYRIRGAKWKLPKPSATSTLLAKTQGSKGTRIQKTLNANAFFSLPRSSNTSALKPTESKRVISSASILEGNTDHISALQIGPSAEDIARELDDLPSDAFLSSPDIGPSKQDYPVNPPSRPKQILVGPQTGLHQTTLFGGRAPGEEPPPSQMNKVHNYRVDTVPEAPTHHILDHKALETWVYPTNLGPIRNYQFNIVRQGLFNNILVALPTGLGKTFIAATIMLNYFRWTKDAKIVFMAPTRPLVSQQVDACFNIAGIPRSVTTMLTGEIPPALREEAWQQKRVFFMTPQTLDNDLRTGIADPKKIVLLVVDEAHRATGNYSYVKIVSFMRRFSNSFRILALTATPGASIEAVQEIIDGLEISKVEIRTEESMDIQQFTHWRKIEQILLDPSDEIIMVKDLLSKALQPLVDQLCGQNAYWNKDPMSLTAFGLVQAQKSWFLSDAGRRANPGLKGMMKSLFSILASVAHGIKLLNFHGIGPFYAAMKDFRASVEEKGDKAGKYRRQINDNPHFQRLMESVETWINKGDFVGHPKLTYLCDTILNHFLDAGEGRLPADAPHSRTRVIVFSEYRDSAEEICRVLNRHKPMIRASVFVGQADSKRSEGMNQTKQIETISKFKTGTFNVLVATSIGEEGLDIGQVDLIVCYDASGSPIRMLQRMGRTGRKRAGNVVLLLMRGKEEEAFVKSKDNYEQMQKMIASGTRFNFRHDLSTRIIPKDISPVVDKRHVEIPLENTQDHSLPEPKRRPSKVKKKSAKKFHMPDDVEIGFRKASKFLKNDRDSEESDVIPLETLEVELIPIPEIDSVLLSATDLKDLERSYQNVHGDDTQEVSMPDMNCQPEFQRSLGPSKFVQHGKAAERFVCMIGAVRNMTEAIVDRWKQIYEDRGAIDLQHAFGSQSPASSLVSSAISSFNSREEQCGLDDSSRPKWPSKPSKARQGRSMPSLSGDQSDTCCSSSSDSGVEDFAVQDTKLLYKRHLASTHSSSPPPDFPPPKSKPFFEPTQFTATQDTNDDNDDMPDVSDLLRSKTTQPSRSPLMQKHVDDNVVPQRGRRGKKRWTLDDDSDG